MPCKISLFPASCLVSPFFSESFVSPTALGRSGDPGHRGGGTSQWVQDKRHSKNRHPEWVVSLPGRQPCSREAGTDPRHRPGHGACKADARGPKEEQPKVTPSTDGPTSMLRHSRRLCQEPGGSGHFLLIFRGLILPCGPRLPHLSIWSCHVPGSQRQRG